MLHITALLHAARPRRALIAITLGAALLLPAARPAAASTTPMAANTSILMLTHSTGFVVWNNGVPGWFTTYNSAHGTNYAITRVGFPFSPYADNNYPWDYWNIWVNHAGPTAYMGNPTLEMLTAQYNVIMWKHCFPVSAIYPDLGTPDVTSSDRRLENYRAQYAALKTKMNSFPNTRFIVWTGAARLAIETTPAMAESSKVWANWVKNTWDVPGDNIYVWDFYNFETDGGIYMNPLHSLGTDSHPNDAFGAVMAPLVSQRVVDVILGNGDTNGTTGVPSAGVQALSFALDSSNPGTGLVRFRIALPRASHVNMSIYDMSGRLVAQVDAGFVAAGERTIAWDRQGAHGKPGVFFAHVKTDAGEATRRIVLLD